MIPECPPASALFDDELPPDTMDVDVQISHEDELAKETLESKPTSPSSPLDPTGTENRESALPSPILSNPKRSSISLLSPVPHFHPLPFARVARHGTSHPRACGYTCCGPPVDFDVAQCTYQLSSHVQLHTCIAKSPDAWRRGFERWPNTTKE